MQEETFKIARLISGYLRNQLTQEEEDYLMEILKKDERKHRILEYYKNTASAQERLDYMNGLDLDAAWQKVNYRFNHISTPKPKIRLSFLKYVAVFAIFVSSISLWVLSNKKDPKIVPDITHNYKNDVLPGSTMAQLILSDGRKMLLDSGAKMIQEKNGTNLSVNAGIVTYNNPDARNINETLYNTLVVPAAGTYALQLPDGTKVWLNAMSELKFPLQFNGAKRKIELKGEAFFEVKKDAGHPFIVSLNGSEIEVLGTSFNVCSYNHTAKTTLIEGSVKIRNRNEIAFLKPGQQAVVNNSELKISAGDIQKAMAWINGDFYFSNDRIELVLEQISKWYDLKIIYKNNVPNIRIGGSVSRKVKLSEVLQMLKDVSSLSFQIDGRNLIVN